METRTGCLFKRSNGVYYVQIRFDGKTIWKSTGCRNKKDAEKRRAEIMEPFVAGKDVTMLRNVQAKIEGREAEVAAWEEKNNPPLKMSQAWREFIHSTNRPDTGEATLRQYQFQFNHFASWIETRLPSAAMRNVTAEHAEEYAGHLVREGKSPNTYNKYLSLLSLVFRVLKKKARLPDNPWEDLQRKKLSPNTRRELTLDELRTVCESAEGEMRLLFALGIYTGLRLGDCSNLRWSEVDLDRGFIRRVQNKVRKSNPKPVTIGIHPVLRQMLQETLKGKRRGFVLPSTAKDYERRIDAVTDQVQAHFKACGIETKRPGTGKRINADGKSIGKRAVVEVGFHSLRHTFVSLCRESNAPLAVVEAIVGHSNPAMTRLYTHVGEAAIGAAVAALPSVVDDEDQATPPAQVIIETGPVLALVEKLPNTKAVKPIKEELLALLVG